MSKNKFSISAKVEGSKGVIRISGEISGWKNHAEGFRSELKEISDAGISDLELYINSPGGDCAEAGEIVNELIPFKGTKKAILGVMCASAASYISAHCDTVKAAKNHNHMIHKPWGHAVGNAPEIEAQVKLLKNLEKEYADAYSKKTGLPVSKIEALWVEDYWMNATEAKALGFIDEIEGEAEVTEEEISALKAKGYKNMPEIKATLKTEDKQPTMKKIIAILASFPGLTIAQDASEDVAAAHVETLKLKAMAHDDIKKKYDDLVVQAKTEKVEAELNIHAAAKRFAPAARGFWKKALLENFEEAKATLDAMPAVAQLSKETNPSGNAGGVDRSKWTYAEYMEKDPHALETLAKEDETAYRALFKAHYGHDDI